MNEMWGVCNIKDDLLGVECEECYECVFKLATASHKTLFALVVRQRLVGRLRHQGAENVALLFLLQLIRVLLSEGWIIDSDLLGKRGVG